MPVPSAASTATCVVLDAVPVEAIEELRPKSSSPRRPTIVVVRAGSGRRRPPG